MKKLLLIVFGFVILLVISNFIPVKHTDIIKVNGDYSGLAEKMRFPDNWKKWWLIPDGNDLVWSNEDLNQVPPPKSFKVADDKATFVINILNPVSFTVAEDREKKSTDYSFHIVPTTVEDSFHIVVQHKQNIFTWLTENPEKDLGYSIATAMKNFMENPTAYYGYPIEMTTTVDLNVITIKDTIIASAKTGRLQEMYGSLERFIRKNQLSQVQKRIAYYKPYQQDSLIIMTGIAVNKLPQSAGEIEAVQMPETRILMTRFRGPYYKIGEAYTSLENYVEDHKFQKIALPFERYLSDSFPKSDSMQVEIDIYYPIR